MKIQIDDTVREATAEEVAAIKTLQSGQTLEEQVAARQAALESARAKLAKLGLTDDELEAFFGV